MSLGSLPRFDSLPELHHVRQLVHAISVERMWVRGNFPDLSHRRKVTSETPRSSAVSLMLSTSRALLGSEFLVGMCEATANAGPSSPCERTLTGNLETQLSYYVGMRVTTGFLSRFDIDPPTPTLALPPVVCEVVSSSGRPYPPTG